MRCLRSHSSFISARDLFGPQENHESFIANERNEHDKLLSGRPRVETASYMRIKMNKIMGGNEMTSRSKKRRCWPIFYSVTLLRPRLGQLPIGTRPRQTNASSSICSSRAVFLQKVYKFLRP